MVSVSFVTSVTAVDTFISGNVISGVVSFNIVRSVHCK